MMKTCEGAKRTDMICYIRNIGRQGPRTADRETRLLRGLRLNRRISLAGARGFQLYGERKERWLHILGLDVD